MKQSPDTYATPVGRTLRLSLCRRIAQLSLLATALTLASCIKESRMLQVVFTSDVRGAILPYDFKRDTVMNSSLANISTLVDDMRLMYGDDNVLLLDNGGTLTGRVVPFYSNYIDTVSEPIYYRAERIMGYDAIGIGDHDMDIYECLHPRRLAHGYTRPIVCANLLDARTNEPYFKPYQVFKRGGMKVAVLGMASPEVSAWLPKQLWRGLYMQDMVECAEQWVPIIQEREHPDILIGLFSCGRDVNAGTHNYDSYKNPNGGLAVARNVPGFDLIILGRDKDPRSFDLRNNAGKIVRVINVGQRATHVGTCTIHMLRQPDGTYRKRIFANVSLADRSPIDPTFESEFADDFKKIYSWVNTPLGYIRDTLHPMSSLVLPSAYRSLIHSAQLWYTGADVSITGIITSSTTVPAGPLCMRDLIDIDNYDYQLIKMRMSGDELYRLMEYTYGQVMEQMHSPDDNLLAMRRTPFGSVVHDDEGHPFLAMPPMNYLTYAGVRYTIDVTKPAGHRITILSMHDGTPFDMHKSYNVAINSFHGSGGDDILTKGIGWNKETLDMHTLPTTPYRLREVLAEYLQHVDTFDCHLTGDFSFIPADWAEKARKNLQKSPPPTW